MTILHDFSPLDNKKDCSNPSALLETFSLMCQALFSLGVTANYTGFYPTAYAAALAALNSELLRSVTKCLYPQVAEQYHTNWKAVERNIRTVVNVAWINQPGLLDHLAHRHFYDKPRNAVFLAVLSQTFRTGELPELLHMPHDCTS